MAIRPYEGVIRNSVPSNFDPKTADLSTPQESLSLNFVHGFRCFDTRNNIFYKDSNNIIFHNAAVNVSMHKY